MQWFWGFRNWAVSLALCLSLFSLPGPALVSPLIHPSASRPSLFENSSVLLSFPFQLLSQCFSRLFPPPSVQLSCDNVEESTCLDFLCSFPRIMHVLLWLRFSAVPCVNWSFPNYYLERFSHLRPLLWVRDVIPLRDCCGGS